MALFKYTAKDREGKIYERTVEVADRLAIYGIIRGEGSSVMGITELKSKKFLSSLSLGSLFSGIKTQDKINLAKNLGSMVSAGLSVTRALSVMGKQSKNKKLRELVNGLETDLNKGTPLSDALGHRPKIFSPLFVSMVKAGEESGGVAEALKIVAGQMEKTHQLGKKVRGAMIYPVVILSVMLVLAVILLVYMVPTLTATFTGLGVTLPLPTRIIIASSNFMVGHTLIILLVLILLVGSLVFFIRRATGKRFVDILSIRLPVIGLMVKEFQAARMARTLSSLLSAGVEIVVALEVTSSILQNHLYKKVLDEAHAAIQKGEQLSAIFGRHEDICPIFVEEMTAVGEETGNISLMLAGVADFYEEEVDQATKDLSTIIEPLLMIIIGAGVGIFAISMLLPTYSLVNYIG